MSHPEFKTCPFCGEHPELTKHFKRDEFYIEHEVPRKVLRSDRELLEMAAKATGRTLLEKGKKPKLALLDDDPVYTPWNPLTSDIDAFRLAVDMGIKTRWHSVLFQALAWPIVGDEVRVGAETCGNEKYAAVRRSIVLAAAGACEPVKCPMCASCKHADRNCSHLPFSDMRPVKKYSDGSVAVICTELERKSEVKNAG